MMMDYEITSNMAAQQRKMIEDMKVGLASSFAIPDIMAPHQEMMESFKVGLASSFAIPDIMAPHREMMESFKVGLASSFAIPDIMAPHREMMESLKVSLASTYTVPDIMAPHRKMFENMKVGLDATFKIVDAVERQENYLKEITTAIKGPDLNGLANISNIDISKAIESVKENAAEEFQEFLDDMSCQDHNLKTTQKVGKEYVELANQSVRNVLSNEYVTTVARLLVFTVLVGETVDYDIRIIILTGLANYFFPFSFSDDKNKNE